MFAQLCCKIQSLIQYFCIISVVQLFPHVTLQEYTRVFEMETRQSMNGYALRS